ncbi:permease-like cell division protein FtsX [uncultured Granulicatella sp.]|jgi:cell division ABC transporter permease ftsX|uniref:permease-like cell division protein FtsX n=1 Tax=uncultured Granulicatella sp. TaxID=316089 RepID=UPI0028EC31AC|nr:permease-like cell division protein FtsX [uncultured Granulicatella sp.]
MKIRTMWRHIRDAVKSLFRNGWSTFGAISAVSMVLLLVGIFVSLLFNMNKIATDVEQDVNVRVYIDLAADETKTEELKAAIQALNAVDTVKFRSKDEELDDITKSVAQEFELFKNDSNPLRNAFDVSTKNPKQTKEVATTIEKMDYVARVNYGGAKADTLFKVISTSRNVGIGVIAVLLIIALFLISNTIRATIHARRTEIEIMQLVGATKAYIRWPFFLEGGFIGLIGSIVPIAVLWGLYLWVYKGGSDFFAGSNFSLLSPNPFLYRLSLAMAGVGVLIGSFGSIFSMRRFLKK